MFVFYYFFSKKGKARSIEVDIPTRLAPLLLPIETANPNIIYIKKKEDNKRHERT